MVVSFEEGHVPDHISRRKDIDLLLRSFFPSLRPAMRIVNQSQTVGCNTLAKAFWRTTVSTIWVKEYQLWQAILGGRNAT